jgi:hypothetical protein
MKIRIKGNSVRYRLTQSEVRDLPEKGRLCESTCFGPAPEQTFYYALETKADIEGLQAAFDGQQITLYLDAEAARTWHQDTRVGFNASIEVAPGVKLGLLIEKDFACLDPTHEDQSDNYPNPNAVCGTG